ncbi:hypothetical protein JX266_005388 [Neoarthrinium moseri]|nr:hypothetical protein JX266_005388 [Neoarthrinium moseri]
MDLGLHQLANHISQRSVSLASSTPTSDANCSPTVRQLCSPEALNSTLSPTGAQPGYRPGVPCLPSQELQLKEARSAPGLMRQQSSCCHRAIAAEIGDDNAKGDRSLRDVVGDLVEQFNVVLL